CNSFGYSTFRCILRFEGVTDWHQSLVTMSSATSDVTYTSVYTTRAGRAFWGAIMRGYWREAYHPLPPVDSPTAESPGYITESDPEEDPEEYEDDEAEDGPVDYPMDGGDDGNDGDDDDDGESCWG
ncbi:hypothetical protein Tco_0922561, partial [Tanacetum coccineum]